MTQYQSDYYAAMVMAASNYSDVPSMPQHPQPHQSYFQAMANANNATGGPYDGMSYGGPARTQRFTPYTLPSPVASPMSGGQSALATLTTNPNIPQNPTKRYTHNPYASEPSTPTSNDARMNGSVHSHNSSFNTSTDSFNGFNGQSGQQQPMFTPVYAPEGSYSDSVSYPVVNNLTDQFMAIVGSIVPTACSGRGRHLLISIMRLQHLDKIQMIFDEVVPHINMLILDAQGCHIVRTLVEFLTPDQLAVFVSYITPSVVLEMATNSQHTRRVLQTLFERHKSPALRGIVDTITSDCVRLAMTQQGCIAIMRIIEHSLPEQRQQVVAKLIPELPALTMDAYGNYVVQCILQNFEPLSCSAVVCSAFAGHWVQLSCNKFASNVMEKVVRMIVGPSRAALVDELVFNTHNLQCLMQDGFGNFVLQAVIESSNDAGEFRIIADHVRPLLHTSPYGHKIDGKLKMKRFVRAGGPANVPLDGSHSGYSSGN